MTITTEMITTGIGLICFIATCGATIWRVSWIVSQALSNMKMEFNALLTLKDAEWDSKLGKVWERFDVYKNTCDDTFIRKETCALIHASSSKEIIELNHKFDKLDQKIDTYLQALVVSKAN